MHDLNSDQAHTLFIIPLCNKSKQNVKVFCVCFSKKCNIVLHQDLIHKYRIENASNFIPTFFIFM